MPTVPGPLYKKLCPPTLGSAADVIALLNKSVPVLVGLDVNTAFYLVTANGDGVVDPDDSTYAEVGGHAVVAVGLARLGIVCTDGTANVEGLVDPAIVVRWSLTD